MNIGRYQLVEKLGQGGMGVVYRAFDTLLHRVVAVKVISGTVEAGVEQRERFFREARAAGQLSHRNIITIHDLGDHEGQPYLAMELLEGEDLQRRLVRPDRMSLAHKVDLAIEICEGLEYAHARGVIHRDIKPANIFITANGTARILDFGLARTVTSELTSSHMMMGTVNYMSPEQVRGERADSRSDIFSVGVVLYELLGGRKAFEGDSFAATMYKILQEEPEPLLTLDPSLPPELVAIVERALAKPRDERYQSMSEMLRDLAVVRQQVTAYDSPAVGRPASGGPARQSDPPRALPVSHPGSDAPTMAEPTPVPAAPGRPASGPGPSPAAAAGAPTPGSAAGVSALGPLGSRRAIWLSVAAAVVLAAVGFALWSSRSARTPGAPQGTATAPPADRSPEVAGLVRQAAQALQAGELADAERHADAALALAPAHAEARRIRDRASSTLENVTRGLEAARAHFQAGRYEEASRAAGDVLSLVPQHAEASRLMQDAAARSRGRGADEARRRMVQAKAAAQTAAAATLAAVSYNAALGAERTAQRLYDAGQHAEATAKFYEASGLFRSAELAAQSEAAARAERAAAARAERERAERERAEQERAERERAEKERAEKERAEKERAEKDRAAKPERERQPPPEPLPSPPVARGADPQVAAGAPVAAVPPKAPPPAPPPAEPPAENLIADALSRYEAALEARNLAALKRVWPTLSGTQEAALREEFLHARRIEVDINSPRIDVAGATATATFVRRYEVLKTDGQLLNSRSVTTVSLRKTSGGWVIDQIRFDPFR